MARKRRRRRRKNVPTLKGITQDVTTGAVDAVQVLAGKAAARIIPEQLGIPKEGTTGIAAQAAVAVAVGIFGRQLFGADVAKMMMAGALTAPVESIIVQADVPVLGPALSAYPQFRAYVQPGAGDRLPSNRIPALSAWPDVGLEAYDDGAGYGSGY